MDDINEKYLFQIVVVPFKKGLNKIIKDYSYIQIYDDFDINQYPKFINNFNESKAVIINFYIETNTNKTFFIIGFRKTVIIIKPSLLSLIKPLFISNQEIKIYFLPKVKDTFEQYIYTNHHKFECNQDFLNEMDSFNKEIHIEQNSGPIINNIKNVISSCITGYIIREGYDKINQKQTILFSSHEIKNTKFERTTKEDYISLRFLGKGSTAEVELIYIIKKEELFALILTDSTDQKVSKLFERQYQNYLNIDYPFIPKFYGKIENENYLVIQFIHGKTLNNIEQFNLTINEKIIIIFELLITFNYLHEKGYVYRDLKPDNIMIDENKNIFLIDFDRMIKLSEKTSCENHTLDFQCDFVDKEVFKGNISDKNDIYSIGKIIDFILFDHIVIGSNKLKYEILIVDSADTISHINLIYKKCINDDINKRPSIFELLSEFYFVFKFYINKSFICGSPEVKIFNQYDINIKESLDKDFNKAITYYRISADKNDPNAQFNFGLIYFEGKYITQNISKAINYFTLAADQNHLDAQFDLGFIYYEGKYITQNINKAIHYFTLAANQNHIYAQYKLGTVFFYNRVAANISKAIHYFTLAANQNHLNAQLHLAAIYFVDEYVKRDINKSIHYFTLAANQNCPEAQYYLGFIYSKNQYITQDINKAIHYFTLASNQNFANAQFSIGFIYLEGKYITRDINKAIHFFTLAADQNHTDAQYNLGFIYFEGKYITQNINKAIHFFTLAADQNHRDAQFNLGFIYFEGKYIKKNINKAIHFFTLAADQNHTGAQYNLGIIYYEGKHVTKDINKAINYFSLTADQNHLEAQYNLGVIYYEGKHVTKDINKAVNYFSLAADKNHLKAQYNLGIIHYEGIHVKRDINEAIHYLLLAADQNHPNAQFYLGIIFYKCQLVTRDINKAIHYFTLSANQNHSDAQFNLGVIYYEGKLVTRDINKAIHYFTLSANQNHSDAQFYLGVINGDNIYTRRNINKSIYYFSLAAAQKHAKALNSLGLIFLNKIYQNQDIKKAIYYFEQAANENLSDAFYNLGLLYYYENNFFDIKKAIKYFNEASIRKIALASLRLSEIYYDGKYIQQDLNKSMHFLTLAANQNNDIAQYNIGILYIVGYYFDKNKTKGISYLIKSSENGNTDSHFVLGFFYFEGKYFNKDVEKSIEYYKKASSFNHQYAKNNLGIIYKNGIDIKEPNIYFAKPFFKEAIKQKNDKLALYNLAHIYIYEDKREKSINKAIELLIKSSNQKFMPSVLLLTIILLKKYGFNYQNIRKALLQKVEKNSYTLLKVFYIIHYIIQNNDEILENTYQEIKGYDYMYDFRFKVINTKPLNKLLSIKPKKETVHDITNEFYEGFSIF